MGMPPASRMPSRQFEMMAVAGREIGTCLGDADDGPPRLQFIERQAEIHVALQVQRGGIGMRAIVEPGARAQLAGRGGISVRVAHGRRFCTVNRYTMVFS